MCVEHVPHAGNSTCSGVCVCCYISVQKLSSTLAEQASANLRLTQFKYLTLNYNFVLNVFAEFSVHLVSNN
jgi:hypothetical protein